MRKTEQQSRNAFISSCLLIFSMLILAVNVIAQAPNITYSPSTVNFPVGTAISPLTPTNSGGAPMLTPAQVSNYAGTGVGGFANNNTLTSAQFFRPNGLAIDSDGTIYVAEVLNNVIRRLSIFGVDHIGNSSGTAGSQDGNYTSTSFDSPNNIAITSGDIIYVADGGNNKIRKITLPSTVTTFAGSGVSGGANGTGTAATFSYPSAIATDAAANVYVADLNYKIRKITPAGVVTDFIGSGTEAIVDGIGNAASISTVLGMIADANYIYFTDGNTIRRITISTRQVTTIAGSSTSGAADGIGTAASFNSPNALALSSTGDLYIADSYNNKIRKLQLQNNQVSTFAGDGTSGYLNGDAASARFRTPDGLTFDAQGNLYVADQANDRIRKITPLVDAYSISPALPAGLVFNTTTGVISGTPTAASAATVYTVTANNASGSSTFDITLATVASTQITTSVTSLTAFTSCSGVASAAQNFTVSGSGLTANLVITAPTGFEVSTSAGSGYGGSVNLSPSSGAVANTTIYARLSATATGSPSGNITCASTGATTQNIAVSGTVASISLAAGSQTNISCNGGSNGSASVTPSGGAGGYTYSWSPSGGTAATATGLSAGAYTVTVTDANSCSATRTFTITQPTAISTATGSQTNISCNGGSNGSATVTPSGGAGGYTYSWSPSGGTAATATGLTAGSYTVTVTDANSCSATRTFTITEPSAISTATGSQTNISCNGGSNGSATVTPSGGAGGYTYSWSPSGGTAATATGLTAGSYTVTVTDANSCSATRTFTITEPSAISTATGSQTNVSCNGGSNGSASVTPSGGAGTYTYSWSPSGGTAATATGLSAGAYTVTVTDANSCSATRTFTITEPSAISTATGSQTNISCNGGSNGSATVTPSGGAGGYTYSWSPSGDTAATATGLSAGTYTVTVTDANSCSATRNFTITQPTAIAISVLSQTNVSCSGGSNGAASINTPTGGAGGYTYNWTPGNPTGDGTTSVTGLTAGTWTCTVTDANACTATQTFIITATALPIVSISGTDAICVGATTTLSPTTGGTWASSNASIATVTNAGVVTGIANGSATFTFTNTTTGCTSLPTATVTVNSIPTAPVISSGVPTFCDGQSANLYSNYIFNNVWYKDGNIAPNSSSTGDYNASTAGTYTAKQVINGCSSGFSNAIVITVNPLPTFTLGTVTNVSTTATSFSLPYSGTSGSPISYVINTRSNGIALSMPGFSSVSGALTSSPIVVPIPASAVGTYGFGIVMTNSNGCTSGIEQFFTLTVVAPPCTPTTGTFTVAACDTYTWAAKGNKVYTASNNTDTIHVINAGGCDSLVTLNLTITPTPSAPVISTAPFSGTSFCEGSSTLIESDFVNNNVWYKNGNVIAGAVAQFYSADTTATYTAKQVINGCSSAFSNSISTTMILKPTFTLGTINNVTTTATSFDFVYSNIASTPNSFEVKWDYSPGAVPMQNFYGFTTTAVSSPIAVTIPNSSPNTYNFEAFFYSGSGSTCSSSKKFTLTVVAASAITTSTTSLPAFTSCSGTASTAQNFTVSGSGLTADILITAPFGFEVSKSAGSGYGGSVLLTESNGTVAATTIYTRLSATATGSPSGNITFDSPPVAVTPTIAVSGTVNPNPAAPNISDNGITNYGDTLKIFRTSATNSNSLEWYFAISNGINVGSIQIPNQSGDTIKHANTQSHNARYYLRETNSFGCTSEFSNQVNKSGTYPPIALETDPNNTLCGSVATTSQAFNLLQEPVLTTVIAESSSNKYIECSWLNTSAQAMLMSTKACRDNSSNFLARLSDYVAPRRFEIYPLNNNRMDTVSGRLILYYTQQEFDNFNTYSDIDLPTNPSDAAGKANLRIMRKIGLSGDGSGLPGSYTGATGYINPVDADIVWIPGVNYWSVSFDVTGFGGFFLTTENAEFLPPGNAITLDGVNDYIRMPVGLTNDNQSQSIEFWTKINGSIPTGDKKLYVRGEDGSGAGWSNSVYISSDGKLNLFNCCAVPGNGLITSSTVIVPNRWYHVAAVFNAATNTQHLYINGILQGSANTWVPFRNSTIGYQFGRGNGNEWINETVDEIRIWTKALTPSEIQAGMYDTVPSNSPNLAAYYKFDQGTAGGDNTSVTAITNAASNSNHATISGVAMTGSVSNIVESYAMVVPTATAASNVTTTSFTAHWTAPLRGVVNNGYRVEVSTVANFATQIAGSPFTVLSGLSTTINGLASGTSYYYRIRANKTSVNNQGGYSNTVSVSSVLPLQLLSFTAQKQLNQVICKWETTNEINTSNFVVERSTNGNNFYAIGSLQAANTAGNHQYLFTNDISSINAKTVYYRLQMVDKDGKTTYSAIRKIDLTGKLSTLSIYPNPIKGNSFTVDLGVDISKPIVYILYNSIGKLVQQGTISSRQQTIHTGILPAGSYLLRLTNGQTVTIIK